LDELGIMAEFLKLIPPLDALDILLKDFSHTPQTEEIETASALGRVILSPVFAPYPLPSFPRSTVDGYAVRAADTFGASESLPGYLQVIGEVPMGAAPGLSIAPAQSAVIHTGGMLPEGANAVVMLEYTQTVRAQEVEILRAVSVGENVIQVGEDVIEGQEVIPAGRRLRPAEIGGLMALGITRITVSRRPRVGILSSGDEVVPPGVELAPGQVYDVNSFSLSALVEETGGVPWRYGIIPDQAHEMRRVAAKALQECDLVIITAGSSASARDLTAQVINEMGKPGVLVHGVNIKPGKPTILAVCDGKVMIGLPGNPVSALVIAYMFVVPVVERLMGLAHPPPRASVLARLSLNLPSQAGREDWVAVRLSRQPDGFLAEPVFGKSNLIFTLARADGMVRIPPPATGLSAGEVVEVILR
jgi:molybdopterin molybdotransferase